MDEAMLQHGTTPRVLATYRITNAGAGIAARAEVLAAEQSVEMPVDAIRDPAVTATILARVAGIESAGNDHLVTLALAAATTGHEPSQLANMLFGNCSLQPDVTLEAVAFPDGYANAFAKPAFGIKGLRTAVGAANRALTCTALKPQGSTIDHLAKLAGDFARAGIDVIKDDHGLANQAFSPFDQRVPQIQAAIEAANRDTGGLTVYAPTFSGGSRALERQIQVARDCGVGAALVAPMLVGLPALQDLREALGVPILAHPALGGASRIAPAVLFGQLFRLCGADAIIFPNHGGRFSYSRETCLSIAAAARGPWPGVASAMPVPAGGMSVERVPEMLNDFGNDVMLLIGGNLLAAGEALPARAREFVAAVHGGGRP